MRAYHPVVSQELTKVAMGAGATMFDMLRRGGGAVTQALSHKSLSNAGAGVGEGVGRVVGSLKGMFEGATPYQRSRILEEAAQTGRSVGGKVAPPAAKALAALAVAYLLKRNLYDRDGPPEPTRPIFPDHYSYPNY